MKANLKRVLCFLIVCLLLLGLCACEDDSNATDAPIFEGELPEVIFGTWYPHPEVSDIPIEVRSDGTCSIEGQLYN